MDEPSSALDPRAEDALFQAIRDRQGRATTILITHRLANVRHADRIFVLHHGALVEAGTHDDLVAAAAGTPNCSALQAAGYLDPHRQPANPGNPSWTPTFPRLPHRHSPPVSSDPGGRSTRSSPSWHSWS